MKKTLSLLCLSLAAYTGMAQSTNSAKLDTLLSTYNKIYKFNGTALVVKNGEVLIDKGYGYRDAKQHIPHDPNSVFQIGSVTKQFTGAIILKLQEQKKLNVKDKISKYFPTYSKADSITIENLLTHTSGIFNYTNDRAFMATEVSKPSNQEKIMAMFATRPLDFAPGKQFNYSNSGYMLLGYIIEKVTKKRYDQVVHELIFKPLKMTHSGFDFTHLAIPEKSVGYFALNNKDTAASPIVDSSVAFAAGAIYSTTGDLYRWHRALQDNKILSKTQQEEAYHPFLNGYGYGWNIDSVEGKRRVQHGGGIHGFTSNLSRIPQDDIFIMLISNNSSNSLQEITNKIYTLLYGKPYTLPEIRTPINLPDEKLKEYVGTYQIKPELKIRLSVKDGQLLGEPTNQPSSIIYAQKEDLFFARQPDVQLKFIRNEKKEIVSFILFQGGLELTCPKLAE